MTMPEPPVALRDRLLWTAIRQALLIMLGAIECYLGIERSREPQHVRKAREAALQERH